MPAQAEMSVYAPGSRFLTACRSYRTLTSLSANFSPYASIFFSYGEPSKISTVGRVQRALGCNRGI